MANQPQQAQAPAHPPLAVKFDEGIHAITKAYRQKYEGQYGFKVDKTHYAEAGKHTLTAPSPSNVDPLLAQFQGELHTFTINFNKDNAGSNLVFWYSGVHMKKLTAAIRGTIEHGPDTQIVKS